MVICGKGLELFTLDLRQVNVSGDALLHAFIYHRINNFKKWSHDQIMIHSDKVTRLDLIYMKNTRELNVFCAFNDDLNLRNDDQD